MGSKYEELILDGRWKFKRWFKGLAIFENIFNHQEIKLSKRQIDAVLGGRISVSKIICKRIRKETSSNYWIRNKF